MNEFEAECYPNGSQVFGGNDGGETVKCTAPSMGAHGDRSWIAKKGKEQVTGTSWHSCSNTLLSLLLCGQRCVSRYQS